MCKCCCVVHLIRVVEKVARHTLPLLSLMLSYIATVGPNE